MYKFRLTEIELSNGHKFEPGNLTVLIGPNNVGKSRFLKDIVKIVARQGSKSILVKRVATAIPDSYETLIKAYKHVERVSQPPPSQARSIWIAPNLCSSGGHTCPQHIVPAQFNKSLDPTNKDRQSHLFGHFGGGLLTHLTTEHRLQLLNPFNTAHAANGQKLHLTQALYNSSIATERRIKNIVKNAFNTEVALDFSEPGMMRFRVNESFADVPKDPREARPVLQGFKTLEEQGDGIRSFVGIVVGLESMSRDVTLVDEPEAFLHPPQAYRIGEFIGRKAKRGKQVFVATHSAEVLKGLLSSFPDATILRIDRKAEANTFRFLATGVVAELIRDPLLSSIRVLDGLFYSAAVPVEADADARFYQAVAAKSLGRDEIYFVNADNKQTVPRVLNAYRRTGMPSAGIVDFDALNSASVLTELMSAADVPAELQKRALEIRELIARKAGERVASERLKEAAKPIEDVIGEVYAAIQAIDGASGSEVEYEKKLTSIRGRLQTIAEGTRPWRELKRAGRAALGSPLDLQFDELYRLLATHGLFINPTGELEALLSSVGIDVTTDKRAWILRALQLIRSLIVDKDQNPWKFVDDVIHYIGAQSFGVVGVPSEPDEDVE